MWHLRNQGRRVWPIEPNLHRGQVRGGIKSDLWIQQRGDEVLGESSFRERVGASMERYEVRMWRQGRQMPPL